MAELDHLEIPDSLLASIRQRAAVAGISVEQQLVRDLSSVAQDQDDRQLLEEIRKEREEMAAKGVFLTEDFLSQAINRGRS
jgi:hypothetical protein